MTDTEVLLLTRRFLKQCVKLEETLAITVVYATTNNATTNKCYKEQVLQGTVLINKIKMRQRKQRNTIGRRSTGVHMTCRAFRFD
jgi:hypothetical protein